MADKKNKQASIKKEKTQKASAISKVKSSKQKVQKGKAVEKIEHKNKTAEKPKKKIKKEKRKKTVAQKKNFKIKETLKKKKHPVFRGRFGARFKRKKSNGKWNKWRYPRGIDIVLKKDDGALPKIGFRSAKKTRFLHPSGLKEIMVSNLNDLSKIKEENIAIRFAGKIGKRKRIEMIKQAKERNVKILNRWKK